MKLKDWAVVVGAAVLGLALVWLFWFVAIRPGQKAAEAAQAKGDGIVAAGEADKARAAVPIIEKHFTERERIERVTVEGNARILAAEGAQDRIPAAVDRAARAALCLHDLYRGDPACQFVPDVDPRRVEAADAGRAPAGR